MRKPPLTLCALFLLALVSLTWLLAACGETSTPSPAKTSVAATTLPSNGPGDNATPAPSAPPSIAAAPTYAASTTYAAATTAASTTYAPGSDAATTSAAAATTSAAQNNAAPTAAMTSAAAATTAAAAGASGGSAASTTYPASNYTVPAYTQPPVDQDPLKAGAVDDNLKFDEYIQYLRDYRANPALPFDVTERYIINVLDSNGRTAANCNIKIYADQSLVFEGKTYSNGQVMFFPRAVSQASQANEFTVEAEKSGRSTNQTFKRILGGQNQNQNGGGVWTLTMPGSLRPAIDPAPNLDLLFLVDSTGSMGGEIQKIQQTINDIAYQISTLPGSPKVRYGVVTYRDRGDIYVTRKFGFTSSLTEFSSFLNSISAGGGGDYPESLNEALHVTVNDMNWNNDDAVRLAFLVADAPPHLDYPNDYKYTDELVNAVKKGIKVYTIGASGLDKQGEYVFRQLAQVTLSQYLFITRNGDEHQYGSGGAASNTNTIYEEKDLNRIVVNIVRRELTNLTQ